MLILSSLANYFIFNFGIFIDSDMMRNVFETNRREALEYVNPRGLLWFFVTGVVPIILIWRTKINFQSCPKEIKTRIFGILICLIFLAIIAASLYKEYVVFGRNNRMITRLINPTNYIYGTIRYFQRKSQSNRLIMPLDTDVRRLPKKSDLITVLVLVIGETSRSMNFSLNGYVKPTNPELSQKEVISFKDVTACGTSTAVSLPCMFSSLPRAKFNLEEAVWTENILDLMKKSGLEVIWLENDNGCKKVCDRLVIRDMVEENNPVFCDGTYCLDEVMIDPLAEILSQVQKDTVVVLHVIGSHGQSYYKRYPREFNIFEPICGTSNIQNCSREQIVNTYDNTIAYTDYLLSRIIENLEKYPKFKAGMLYVSDHGESLGENGLYLHGLPFIFAPEEQKIVPLILWMSELMKNENRINSLCLRLLSEESFSHDHIFHTLAGLTELDTKTYKQDLDFIAACRAPR
jgi:lipid A ethanolaminephosphotransferase